MLAPRLICRPRNLVRVKLFPVARICYRETHVDHRASRVFTLQNDCFQPRTSNSLPELHGTALRSLRFRVIAPPQRS
jgi:hypothetical protein